MVVDGVPEPGEAFPALRTGAGCEAPLQLAAATCSLVRGRRTRAMAIATARMAVRAIRFESGCDGSCAVGSPGPHRRGPAMKVCRDRGERPWSQCRASASTFDPDRTHPLGPTTFLPEQKRGTTMTTPSAGGPAGSSGRVDRIRKRLIWALLGPFGILMSVATVAGFAPVESSRTTTAIVVAARCGGRALPLLMAWLARGDPRARPRPSSTNAVSSASSTAAPATKRSSTA